MSKECSKSILRRVSDASFATRYFAGKGIDIGGKPDPLLLYIELFPRVESIRTWDWDDGDAQYLASEPDGAYDFVHSSHCLEHLVDPRQGLVNWFRVLRPGGHLVITVPDEDLYEQGIFPSTYNKDHKHTFTIWKSASWSAASINVLDLVKTLGPGAEMLKVELLNRGYRYGLPRYDQTLSPTAECAIELVVRKREPSEVEASGRLPGSRQPAPEVRVHLNQYRDDRKIIMAANPDRPPFTNDQPL